MHRSRWVPVRSRCPAPHAGAQAPRADVPVIKPSFSGLQRSLHGRQGRENPADHHRLPTQLRKRALIMPTNRSLPWNDEGRDPAHSRSWRRYLKLVRIHSPHSLATGRLLRSLRAINSARSPSCSTSERSAKILHDGDKTAAKENESAGLASTTESLAVTAFRIPGERNVDRGPLGWCGSPFHY